MAALGGASGVDVAGMDARLVLADAERLETAAILELEATEEAALITELNELDILLETIEEEMSLFEADTTSVLDDVMLSDAKEVADSSVAVEDTVAMSTEALESKIPVVSVPVADSVDIIDSEMSVLSVTVSDSKVSVVSVAVSVAVVSISVDVVASSVSVTVVSYAVNPI